ncbi:MAG: mitochondrial fission ELM1 family protein [Candidatus Omnitrophica bacterium]|nr:mitochondrial fission ELM1 family protein [Candidatus Omnitrophota bacterium]
MNLLIRLVYRLVRFLPLFLSLFLGKVVGLGFYYFDKKKKRIAFINLKQVFPKKTNKFIFSIIRKSFISFGISFIETLIVDRLKNRVRIQFREALPPSGNILVGIHEGSWEFYNSCLTDRFKYAIFVREQRNLAMDKFLNELREKSSLKICTSLKEVAKLLKKNWWVGMVVDHGAEKNSEIVDFFNIPVPTPGGAVYLAKKFGKKIYPAFGYREGNYHIGIIDKPIDCGGKETREILREINKVFEDFLNSYPWTYLWWYKRFKRKKKRRILILSDGRAGHLKQSLNLVDVLEESPYSIEKDILEINYKNRFARFLAEIFASFSTKSCLGCGRCLKFFLDSRNIEFMSKNFFDLVVSTGSLCAPVCAIYSKSLGAKSCCILKPNVTLSKFDLVIAPHHDGVRGKNVVQIKGALSHFKDLQKKVEEGKRLLNLGKDKKVSLFLGNFIYKEKEFCENLKIFLSKLKEFSLTKGYKLLVSTSRRTSLSVERMLRESLANFPNLESLVIVREKNYPFVMETFISLSEIVFVSSDSVSMISESLSIGRPTVSVFLEKMRYRHLNFLNSLKDDFLNFLVFPYSDFTFQAPQKSLWEYNYSQLQKAKEVLL